MTPGIARSWIVGAILILIKSTDKKRCSELVYFIGITVRELLAQCTDGSTKSNYKDEDASCFVGFNARKLLTQFRGGNPKSKAVFTVQSGSTDLVAQGLLRDTWAKKVNI